MEEIQTFCRGMSRSHDLGKNAHTHTSVAICFNIVCFSSKLENLSAQAKPQKTPHFTRMGKVFRTK